MQQLSSGRDVRLMVFGDFWGLLTARGWPSSLFGVTSQMLVIYLVSFLIHALILTQKTAFSSSSSLSSYGLLLGNLSSTMCVVLLSIAPS